MDHDGEKLREAEAVLKDVAALLEKRRAAVEGSRQTIAEIHRPLERSKELLQKLDEHGPKE
jgi:hypothetical protein